MFLPSERRLAGWVGVGHCLQALRPPLTDLLLRSAECYAAEQGVGHRNRAKCASNFLVEDSALLAARLEELIRRLPGVEFIGCEGAEDGAIRRIAESRPDVLVLDLQLRTGSGFGVLRALRSSHHYPKAIVFTNYATAEYRRQAGLLKVAAFLDRGRDVGRLTSLLLGVAEEHRRPNALR